MLDKPNGRVEPVTRAWDARLARIEERIAKSEQSHEQRILILRDAVSDFVADFITNKVAPLHDEIVALKKSNAELRRQLQENSTLDQRVDEVMKRLDARQIARDEAKRGKMGPQGQRGARGERGPSGTKRPCWETRTTQLMVPARNVLHIRLHSNRRYPSPLLGETPLAAAFGDIAAYDAIRNQQDTDLNLDAKAPGSLE